MGGSGRHAVGTGPQLMVNSEKPMISKRFAVGKTLTLPAAAFTPPAHPKNGSMRQQVAVQLTIAPSTGGGLCGGGPKVNAVNVAESAIADRAAQWLYYMPGDISFVPIGGVDVLTGKMSGCPLVIFRHEGVVMAGHIGTEEERPVQNAAVLGAWNAWATAHPADVIAGFYPAGFWNANIPTGNQGNGFAILALLTAGHHHLYSIFLYKQRSGDWRVVGIHRHQSLTLTELQAL